MIEPVCKVAFTLPVTLDMIEDSKRWEALLAEERKRYADSFSGRVAFSDGRDYLNE